MMADSSLREQSRNEITDALTAKLQRSGGYGSSGALCLDRFAYTARRIADTRLEFVTRAEDPVFGYARLKTKYTVLTPEESVESEEDADEAEDMTFQKPAPNVTRQAAAPIAAPVASACASNAVLHHQNEGKEKKAPTMSPKPAEDLAGAGLPQPKVVLFDPAELKMSWTKPYPVGAGLVNIGLTCYINSSLQALIHCPPFAQWIMNEPHCKGGGCDCVMCALSRTVQHSFRSSTPFRPKFILERLRMISKILRPDRQEDSHEFLRSLLSCLQITYLKFKSATKLDVRSQETTPIDQIFGGYIRSQVTCGRCGRKSNTYDHFQDLILDIKNVDTVGQALESYFKKETLAVGTGYKCSRCKTVVSATKKFSIEKPPNVLIIQLKRFENTFRKIGRPVSFPENFDLGRYSSLMEDKQISDGKAGMRYRLNGIVVHCGQSLSFGHYVAYMRGYDGRYYHFNDSVVSVSDFSRLRTSSAYLLFYIRQDDPVFKQPNGVNTPNRVVPTTKATSYNNSMGDSSTSSSPSIPATYPLQNQKRPFIGPVMPPGRVSPAVASSKEAKMSPAQSNNSPKVIVSDQQATFNGQAEKAMGTSRPADKKEPGVKFSFVRASSAALGVKPKVPVTLVIEQRRMAGGADPTPVKPLVPYAAEDDDSDVEEEKKKPSPTPPAEIKPEGPSTPVQRQPSTPVVTSTQKWWIDDERLPTNRSDTSADSGSSTCGKWKAIPARNSAKKAKVDEPPRSDAPKVSSGSSEKQKLVEKKDEAELPSGRKTQEKVTGEAAKRKVKSNGRRQSSPSSSSSLDECEEADRQSIPSKKPRRADSISSRGSKASSSASSPKGGASLHGFGSQVLSWNGEANSLDSELAKQRTAMEERRRAEREYDDEFDQGKDKKKKSKRPRDEVTEEDARRNRFDEFTRMKREHVGEGGDGDRRHGFQYQSRKRSHSHQKPRGWGYNDDHKRNSSWTSSDHKHRVSQW